MANDSRAAVDDLLDGALGNSSGNADEAIEIVTVAREGESGTVAGAEAEPEQPDTKTPDTGGESEPVRVTRAESPAKQARLTKKEALEALAQSGTELEALRRRLEVTEARSNTKAITDLGATFSLALKVAGDVLAAQRGSHWSMSPEETGPMGEAWAVVAAPYAGKLQQAVPWALAIGITWRVIKPRLDQDKVIADVRNAEIDAGPSTD